MTVNISEYKTFLFDCDGVLLDSNKIKSDGFYAIAEPYGKDAAEKLVEYHQTYGGISRFKKIEVLGKEILGKEFNSEQAESLAKKYGDYCFEKTMKCPQTPGLRQFLESLPKQSNRFIVSGGCQDELIEIFQKRGLAGYFDGIYGSPLNKLEILSKLQKEGKINKPALFFGDSRYDHQAAVNINADFVFMSQFTEFDSWQQYFADKSFVHIKNLGQLL